MSSGEIQPRYRYERVESRDCSEFNETPEARASFDVSYTTYDEQLASQISDEQIRTLIQGKDEGHSRIFSHGVYAKLDKHRHNFFRDIVQIPTQNWAVNHFAQILNGDVRGSLGAIGLRDSLFNYTNVPPYPETPKFRRATGINGSPSVAEYAVIIHGMSRVAKVNTYHIRSAASTILESMRDDVVKRKGHLSDSDFDMRLFKAPIVVVDPLTMRSDNNSESPGIYLQREGKIVISTLHHNYLPILKHELFHKLSGHSRIKKILKGTSSEDNPEEESVTNVDRVGLDIRSFISSKRFDWLNEAVTTEQTRTSSLCRQQLELYNAILDCGYMPIDKETIEAAYFEDYTLAISQRMPFWRNFIRTINEAHYPGFLTDIDKVVKEDGIDDAIDLVKNNSPGNNRHSRRFKPDSPLNI
jgi:hypothetical protein